MIDIVVIGTGAISDVYLRNIAGMFRGIRVAGVCDLARERAERAAKTFGIPKVYGSLDEALSDPEARVVLNLTRPFDHYHVTKAALAAGKHVYTEKPLAIDLGEGMELTALARKKGLLLGGAPDTFLGAGLQTCRKLIDDGWIGNPVGASCAMLCHGHEGWHPAPDFYYQRGGGPLMDMGPYYITALVSLLGSVVGVSSAGARSAAERTITSPARFGETVLVEVDTHVCGILHFESGVIATVLLSFDAHCAPQNQSRFEIYGSKGTLLVPDPNTFGGPVRLYRPEDQPRCEAVDPGQLVQAREPLGFRDIPLLFDCAQNSRGLGLADFCGSIETGRQPRADNTLIAHVLEILNAFQRSGEINAYCPIESRYETHYSLI